jgi:hypothetical protein
MILTILRKGKKYGSCINQVFMSQGVYSFRLGSRKMIGIKSRLMLLQSKGKKTLSRLGLKLRKRLQESLLRKRLLELQLRRRLLELLLRRKQRG